MERLGDSFAAGLVHAALGEEDDAFDAFQRISLWSEWPTLSVHYLYKDVWGPLQDDLRYDELVREVDRTWRLESGSNR